MMRRFQEKNRQTSTFSILVVSLFIIFLAGCKQTLNQDLFSLSSNKARFAPVPIITMVSLQQPFYKTNNPPIISLESTLPGAKIFYTYDNTITDLLSFTPYTDNISISYQNDGIIEKRLRAYTSHKDYNPSDILEQIFVFMPSGYIINIAGNGTQGLPVDGNQANFQPLYSPCFIAQLSIHSLSEIYFSDSQNNKVMKIDSEGNIHAVAGSGLSGYTISGSEEDAPATTASLSNPQAFCFDPARSILYIADNGNNRIRKIDFTVTPPLITTVAGNGSTVYQSYEDTTTIPATDANLWGPSGICIDESGNLYVTDTKNNRIRKIFTGTEPPTIKTIAGGEIISASDSFLSPTGLCLDSAGYLYIADTGNNRIQKINLATTPMVISTIAGTGQTVFNSSVEASLNSPTGIAFDESGNLFIADTGNNRIQKIDFSNQSLPITTISGGVTINPTPRFGGNDGPAIDALLNQPKSVFIDDTSNIFIADTGNNRLRKILIY